MNSRDLAARKDLLLAESALHRARLRYQLVALRARRPSLLAIGAPLLGGPLLGLLMLLGGRARMAGAVARAGQLVGLLRLASSIFGMVRARSRRA